MKRYRVSFSGYAYVEANDEDGAEEGFYDGDVLFQDVWIDEIALVEDDCEEE